MGKENFSTPMMEQYARIKKKYADALLFFRLGDFYEMFYEDAKVASSILDIALTSRQKAPMCGVPYHAADSYLAKLLKKGYKVAICEQVEDPKISQGVVRREVVKVLTPGTAVEFELESAKESTYIASMLFQGEEWGLAIIDLSSGELKTFERDSHKGSNMSDELFKISPREVIFPKCQENEVNNVISRSDTSYILKSPQEDWIFDFVRAKNILLDHFQVKSLAGFGLQNNNLAVSCAGALLFYLKKIRKDSLSLIHTISHIHSSDILLLDATTVKNLELVRNLRDGKRKDSLLDIIDFTVTSMGGRLLRKSLLQPLLDFSKIKERSEVVEDFLKHMIERQELREKLKGISDLERITGKISLGVAHAKDLIYLRQSLNLLPEIQTLLPSFSSINIKKIHSEWDNAHDIRKLIEKSIIDEPAFLLTEGGIIKDGYNEELDKLKEISHSGKAFITLIEKKEKERTGISSLKVRYNRVFGYYIEVTKPNLNLVPSDYIRKQTLVNSERFITPELKEYEEKVLNAEQRICELEYNLFLKIREKISVETTRLLTIASNISTLDFLSSLAELAARRNYCRPVVSSDDRLRIIEGRHPVIEVLNEEPFVPNDTYLDRNENQISIVTGPNMGGKSTYLRQVALICILAQMGSFVPADSAEIGVVDRIFTRIGAMDYLSAGESTFMVEMLETANILNNTTSRSLILLDEIGRGTSTFDGISIAWAVAEYLHDKEKIRPKTLFATHYHELTELALTLSRIKNYHVSVKEDKGDVIFLRKIEPGSSDRSYGIHVAKLAGIPRSVIYRAKEILFNLEKKELDDSGLPTIAYHSSKKRNKFQLLLFERDREIEFMEDLKREIDDYDISSMTPLEALNILNEWKKRVKNLKQETLEK